jgi:asparagine synthase (glutamine-hydrolysing)
VCGIAGCVVAEGEEVDLAALERMAVALGHRGPDDSNVEVHGRVGLVSTRLAIVDPGPAGRQPMQDPSGRWVLAYNGEIYNQDELRRGLSGSFTGHSDTETLVCALAAWGEAAVDRCNGIFAFAALDRDRHRLLLVRDHLGVKPLYVARTARALWFASEIKALLAAGVAARPRLDELAVTVAAGWAPGNVTQLDGIDRVPPGTIWHVDLATLRTHETTWYKPSDVVDPVRAAELATRSPDDLVDLLHETLRCAVRRQLMSDVPIGVMCSGGIDSSLIMALAHEGNPDIKLFTASFIGAPRMRSGGRYKPAGISVSTRRSCPSRRMIGAARSSRRYTSTSTPSPAGPW